MISRRETLLGLGLFPWLVSARNPQKTGTHAITMYTVHPELSDQRMVFWPRVVRVAVGDFVQVRPTDPSHNCVSTPGMIPAAAKPWSGAFGKPIELQLRTPGYYGYHCMAHRGMGMVGLIVVEGPGRDTNLTQAKSVRHSGRAAKVWSEIWREIERRGNDGQSSG